MLRVPKLIDIGTVPHKTARVNQSSAQSAFLFPRFLIAGVWRGHQEMWHRAYYKELATDGPFTRIDLSGEDVPGLCVWQMGVSPHERMVWHRYLYSARTEADKRAWLADTYSGRV